MYETKLTEFPLKGAAFEEMSWQGVFIIKNYYYKKKNSRDLKIKSRHSCIQIKNKITTNNL